MLKKISFLVVAFLMTLFLVQPAKNPAHAATLNWEPMVNSTLTSTRSPGFGNNDNLFSNSTVTFDGYVYVSNYNIVNGTEVWRSNNGTTWERVNTNNFDGTIIGGFGELAVFNNSLYAINSLVSANHVDVYKYAGGTTWPLVSEIGGIGNPTIIPMSSAVYNGSLYIGLIDITNPAGISIIYKSNGTDDTNWTASGSTGFDGDADNEIVQSMAVYNGKLYASTLNEATGTEVWSFDGATWAQDNSDGYDSTSDNTSTGTLTSFNGALYASTWNVAGVEIWKTIGGGAMNWAPVSIGGFGSAATNLSYGSIVFKNKLYIGTIADSAKVYRTANGVSFEQVNTDGFGYADNDITVFAVLGDYLYAATGILGGGPINNTTEVYRYYEPTEALPETGFDSPLNAYILDALL
jgi:hypothetical protein